MKRLVFALLAGTILSGHAHAEENELAQIQKELKETREQLRQRDVIVNDLMRRVVAMEQKQRQSTKNQNAIPTKDIVNSNPEPTAQIRPSVPSQSAEVSANNTPQDNNTGQIVIDKLAAEHALDRALVQQGAALLPAWTFELEPAFTFSLAESTSSSFINTPAGITVASIRTKSYVYTGDMIARLGLPWSSQVDLDIPYRYLDQKNTSSVGLNSAGFRTNGGSSLGGVSGGGLSDISISFSKSLAVENGWMPNLIGNIGYVANTSRSIHGQSLGLGYNSIRGLVTASKSFDPLVFIGQLGYDYGLESHGFKPGNEFDMLFGALLSVSPETSMRFELLQQFFDYGTENGRENALSGRTLSSFITGASVIVAPHTLLDVSLGIGLTRDTPGYFLRIGLPIRF